MGYTPVYKGIDSNSTDKEVDEFLQTRKQELEQSGLAREWEKGRKKELQRGKADYLRSKEKKDEGLTREKMGTSVDGEFIPARGYMVVERPDTSGKFVVVGSDEGIRMAKVIKVGLPDITSLGVEMPLPCEEGDTVVLKYGSGLDIKVKDESILLCFFSDVLGTLKK